MPEILPEARLFWAGFEILSAKRLWLDGRPQPIPISEIAAYVNFKGIFTDTTAADFLKVINALDDVYREHTLAKIEEERAKAARAQKGRARR